MTENERFTLNTDSIDRYYQITDEVTGNLFDVYKLSQCETLCDLLNELHEENEHYKLIFFELVETALVDKNCRELYCKGILDMFDEANSLNQARDMIKEFLK